MCARPVLFAGVALEVPFLARAARAPTRPCPHVNEWEEFGDLTTKTRARRSRPTRRGRGARVESFPGAPAATGARDARVGWWESFVRRRRARRRGDAATDCSGPRRRPRHISGRRRDGRDAYDDADLPIAFAGAGDDALAAAVDAVPADETNDATFTVDAAPSSRRRFADKGRRAPHGGLLTHLTTARQPLSPDAALRGRPRSRRQAGRAPVCSSRTSATSSACRRPRCRQMPGMSQPSRPRPRGGAAARRIGPVHDALDGARRHNARCSTSSTVAAARARAPRLRGRRRGVLDPRAPRRLRARSSPTR